MGKLDCPQDLIYSYRYDWECRQPAFTLRITVILLINISYIRIALTMLYEVIPPHFDDYFPAFL
jgi:hypothetical protein